VQTGATRRARFIFALGCIQAQHCHTGACPTGVTTQDPLRQRALVVPDKTERVYRFHEYTLEALKELVQAAGLEHPNQIRANAHRAARRAASASRGCWPTGCLSCSRGELLAAMRGDAPWPHTVYELYWPRAQAASFTAAA